MSQSDEPRSEALKRLDADLKAFEKRRAGTAPGSGAAAASQAYRLMAGLIGGLLGGLGFGWLFDQFAHTAPWGMIGGLLIGIGVSTYGAIRKAGQMSAAQPEEPGPGPAPQVDDEDE
ncbi:AtpZ/AtpI family protein [Phenylobacterium montanum]|uniref:ATP synthase protein I n=1 Tax=Phenylobacterium montanum TaxID=2823693 RepID=A0A975FZJ5_9CAUL|nr:AtpZ/AtpI family protein [Caulobacter sp. S6]QUD87732.1 AtpZ/AtpI family protein [Caulobacter sp. S6]